MERGAQAGVCFGEIREMSYGIGIGLASVFDSMLAPPLVAHVVLDYAEGLFGRERSTILSRASARHREAAIVPAVRHELASAQQLHVGVRVVLLQADVEVAGPEHAVGRNFERLAQRQVKGAQAHTAAASFAKHA